MTCTPIIVMGCSAGTAFIVKRESKKVIIQKHAYCVIILKNQTLRR